MENGIYAAKVEGSKILAVHIDQESAEFAAQNAKVQRRVDRQATDRYRAISRGARKKKAMDKLADQSLKLAIGMAAVTALGYFGLVNWILAAVLDCLGLIAFGTKLGRWAEKAGSKK